MAARVKTLFGHLSPTQDTEFCKASSLQTHIPSGPLEYSLDNGILTPEQRHFYEENGFLHVKNVVSQARLDAYRADFERICNGDVFVPGMTVMKDVAIAKSQAGEKGQRVITKIQNFQDHKPLFEYCSLPEVVKYVTAFTGPNAMAMHTMLINKPPDPGTKSSRHPMHQDLHYFPFRPANKIVCAWTAMERVHRDNGCLVVVPGTHKGDLLEHEYPDWEGGVNKMYHGVKGYNAAMERTWLEMDAGDTVFFHPILLHGSGTNRTDGFRKAISCHYAASECDYVDISGTTQEELADELINSVRKQYTKRTGRDASKLHLDHTTVWRKRARVVAGAKSVNL